MADQIQLSIILSAQVDRVLAGLSSVEKGLAQMQSSQDKAAASASTHQARFDAFTNSVERAGKIFAGVWILWQAAKDVFAGFDSLEKFNLNLQTMTQLLQGNATAASTWMQIAQLMNVDVTQIERSFVALSRQMNNQSSPALKQMGISAVDARGQLKTINDVLLQAADYFHRHEGASNNAALAQQLFGRSGADLLPILEQGRAGINTITESARKYGLILTADAIRRNAEFTEELKVSEMAARGLGTTLGNAALPALSALASGFNNMVSQNLPAFEAAMERAVGYILGFVQRLTGMSFTIDDSAKVLGSLSTATGALGSQQEDASASANALARAEDNVRTHAKAATDQIDKQINSLRNMQDTQKFVDDQARLQQQLADKTRDIGKLQHEQWTQQWLGNFETAADIGDQITKAQEEQGNIQQDLTRGVADEQTRLKIDALERQKKAVQDNADAEIKQMERAAKGGAAAFAAAGVGILAGSKKTAKDSGDAFHDILQSAAAKTGADMAQKLSDAIWGSSTIVRRDNGSIERIVKSPGGDWQKIGNAIGESIGTGISIALGKAWDKFWLDTLKRTASAFKAPSGGYNQRGQYAGAAGAVFTKPTWVLAGEAGVPEALVPLGQGGSIPPGFTSADSAPGASPLASLNRFASPSPAALRVIQGGQAPASSSADGAMLELLRQMVELTKAIAKNSDPSQTNRLLARQSQLLAAVGSALAQRGSGVGAQADLFNAVDDAKRWRALGVVGV